MLVERESAAVVRSCYRILGDRHAAEDAAQEAFVNAFRALPSWRADGPFGAWLTRIAVRVALRAAARRRSVGWVAPLGDAESTLPRTPVASGAFDPAAVALRSERAAEIRSAVAHLEEPYREIVALRFFGELSLTEIATAVERPLPTVKTQLRRGLLRLRATLSEREPLARSDIRVRA